MKRKLIILVCVVVLAGISHWLWSAQHDPLDRFPHAFIAQPGYDPAAVVVVYAPLTQPPPAPVGTAPVWSCSAPAFADAEGHPWLFPLMVVADHPVPPKHPRWGVAPESKSCSAWQTPEGARLLATFKEGFHP